MNQRKSFYNRFHNQLLKSAEWPSNYMFKFIIPTSEKTKDKLFKLFENKNIVSKIKSSKNGNYLSVSFEGIFSGPNEIISIYIKAEKIPGIIQL